MQLISFFINWVLMFGEEFLKTLIVILTFAIFVAIRVFYWENKGGLE